MKNKHGTFSLGRLLQDNIVPIMFIVICIDLLPHVRLFPGLSAQ